MALLTLFAAGAVAQPTASIGVSARSRSLQPGELIVLTLTPSVAVDEVRVRVFGRDLPAFRVDARTWRALVGIDLDRAAGPYVAAIEGRTGKNVLRGSHAFTIRPKQFRTRALTVDPDFVTPPADQDDRIVREANTLDRILNATSPDRWWDGAFVSPVRAAATSAFGSRSVFNGVARSPHSGADFPGAAGTPILAPNAGRVVLAGDLYFSGNTVILDHGLGLFSLMAHMSALSVSEGAVVAAGQVVGTVGATGRVTGPHLHWAVRLGGARVDPVSLLTLLGQQPSSR